MMPLSKSFRSILLSAFLLTANADTLRGVQQRRLQVNEAVIATEEVVPTEDVVRTEEVDLRTAGTYAILTKSGITNVPGSTISGDIAVSPITGAAMTGFSFTSADGGQSATSSQVIGTAYAADYISPTPSRLTIAVGDMEIAYTDAAGRTNPNAEKINLGGGEIGGLTLKSDPLGVYTFGTGVTISNDVIFDGEDNSDAVFIIQMAGNLMVAAHKQVTLINGAKAENIFWQVAGNVAVMAGAHMEGILLVKTDVTFVTGSTLNGRILAQTAANLQSATITQPVPVPTATCDWAVGYLIADSSSYKEMNLSFADSEECLSLVMTHEPAASGATYFGVDGGYKICVAWFGGTHLSQSQSWPYQTCMFRGNVF